MDYNDTDNIPELHDWDYSTVHGMMKVQEYRWRKLRRSWQLFNNPTKYLTLRHKHFLIKLHVVSIREGKKRIQEMLNETTN